MSDYNTYYLKAPLRDSFPDVVAFRDHASSCGVHFDLESKPMVSSSNAPSFGPDTEYAGPSFSHWGLSVDEGILSIGVFASNLERDNWNDEDESGLKLPAKGTRLETLLGFLSDVTDGDPGEIQGAYSAERWDYETHAHPIIRCGDGCLRVARTAATPYDYGTEYGFDRDNQKIVSIPEKLPEDLVSSGYDGAMIDLDVDALLARCTPIALDSSPAMRS